MGNEWADRVAQQGMNNTTKTTTVHISLSLNEGYNVLKSTSQEHFYRRYVDSVLSNLHPAETSHKCCKLGKSLNFATVKGSTILQNFFLPQKH